VLLLRNSTIAAADAARQKQEQQEKGHPQQRLQLQQQNTHQLKPSQYSTPSSNNGYIQSHTYSKHQNTTQQQQRIMSPCQATQQLSRMLQQGSDAALQLLQESGSSQLAGQQLAAACMRGINIGQDNTSAASSNNSSSGAAKAFINITSCCSHNSSNTSCSSSGCTSHSSAAAACSRALQDSLSSMSVASMQQLLHQGQALGLDNSFLDVQQLELQSRLMQLLLPVQAPLDGSAGTAAAPCSVCGSTTYANGQQHCDDCGSQLEDSSDTSSSSGSQLDAAGCVHSLQLCCQQPDPAVLQAALAGVQGFVQQHAVASRSNGGSCCRSSCSKMQMGCSSS
jgi:hypothetical protein